MPDGPKNLKDASASLGIEPNQLLWLVARGDAEALFSEPELARLDAKLGSDAGFRKAVRHAPPPVVVPAAPDVPLPHRVGDSSQRHTAGARMLNGVDLNDPVAARMEYKRLAHPGD